MLSAVVIAHRSYDHEQGSFRWILDLLWMEIIAPRVCWEDISFNLATQYSNKVLASPNEEAKTWDGSSWMIIMGHQSKLE